MSSLRGKLERLKARIGPTPEPPNSGARERAVEHLEHIAQARREGTWTEEDAARASEAVRSEAARRRGEGNTYWLNAQE